MDSGFPPRGHPGFRSGIAGLSTVLKSSPIFAAASDSALAGSLKRPLIEIDKLQLHLQQQQQLQMQIQHALFLRSVKQRTMQQRLPSPVSPLSPPVDLHNNHNIFSPPSNTTSLSPPMRTQLQELERRLLFDDNDDDDDELSSTTASATQPTNSTTSTSTASAAASSSPASTTARRMLIEAAAAIADGNTEAVTANLPALRRAANPRGGPEQRLTAMMLAPLIFKLNHNSSTLPSSGLCSQEHFVSTQLLYNFSPCFKLALIAAGYAILEATKDHSRIRILDFEVAQGCHYAALLKALAERRRGGAPPVVTITAVTDPSAPFTNTNAGNLRAVGDRIEKLGETHGLVVRFNIISVKLAELKPDSLGLEPGEAVAVNLPFVLSRVADESVSPANPRDQLLRTVRGLKPTVVVLVEQELNTNTAPFLSRFTEACSHYGALLESLDSMVDRDAAERVRVEAGLARRAVNSVAREGPDRVERCEVFGKWRARMGMAGLRPVTVGPGVVEPIRARFAATVQKNCEFTIEEEFGGIAVGFGWMGRVLTVASAWH